MAGYWMYARYSGPCNTKDCTNEIEEGDRIYMCDGAAYCKECGEELESDE